MGDEKKLSKLKNEFVHSIKKQSHNDCLDLHLKSLKCLKDTWFGVSCLEEQQAFYDCYKKRLNELHEENKEILEFQINSKK